MNRTALLDTDSAHSEHFLIQSDNFAAYFFNPHISFILFTCNLIIKYGITTTMSTNRKKTCYKEDDLQAEAVDETLRTGVAGINIAGGGGAEEAGGTINKQKPRDSTKNILPLIPGAVGANLCVRPVIPGRHAGLPLQSLI
jgi:hypothetical protein